MSAGWWTWRKSSIVVGCLLLALQVSFAQKSSVASNVQIARTILVEKARALEARGRPDMAVQLWQQILLSEPDNTEALAGLARDLKLIGSADQANEALDRLRRLNPHDPNIAKIEALTSTRAESDQLRQAGQLAKAGRLDDAMRAYRQLYGDHPPDGDIALAYYQTLYGTTNGKEAAIAGMRALADRNPGDDRFAVALGIMLTYDSRTRPEGIRILEAHPNNINAQNGLRQALIWDAANPAAASELRAYIKTHPEDKEMLKHLQEDEYKLAQMNSGIARTPAERAAFAALNAHRLDEAERRFTDLLQQEPNNGRVEAGMGFLRMQQKNFGGAVSYLSQAEQDGYKARVVESALKTSRFWFTMGEATQAFSANQLNLAAMKYRAALEMNPRSPEALNGLAGLLVKEQQYSAAAGIYEQLIRVQPGNVDGWRGLFLAYANDGQNQKALAISARFPGTVRTALDRDPDYLRTLASIYQAEDRPAEAQRVLALALSLPFPNNGSNLEEDTRLQYAGILMEAKRYDQAATLYVQILTTDPASLSAWEGLVSAHHNLGQDQLAINDVERMPAATYDSALSDPGFLSMLGAIYQQANQFEIAQGFLERSAKLQIAAGGQPSVSLQLQLASIYLLRNYTDRAYNIYHQVLLNHPDRPDAWKGLISALIATHHNEQALEEIAQIPSPVRKQLEADIDFEQTEASLYATTDHTAEAIQYMNRVVAHYARLRELPPANIDIQNAWLLYNTGNDRALYAALMRLGGRADLTIAQRETVQTIWANWSVRRAGVAMENGNAQRAVDILDAASQAFPNNITVRKAVAGGYVRVGRAREALALYKTVPMQDATSGDFQGAVGAALAANDKAQAELWLRQALDRYPRDPAILTLAARYEQARGDNERAAEYYRASLAAMPQASPADRLAHMLVYPEQDIRPHKAVTAADLQRLLNPDDEPFPKTTKLPPLPAYGVDPYVGPAPVVLTQPAQQQSPQTVPAVNMPSSVGQQDAPPPVMNIPAGRAQMPTLHPDVEPVSSGGTGAALLGAGAPAQMSGRQAELTEGELSLNPPHSLASDTWKGLIFSLMSGKRYNEALQELAQIPPDVRRQLESDLAFVQGEASLYVAVGDTAHALQYLNRVDNYYLLHRSQAPAGLELQHAWLLYSLHDNAGLYPVLLRLDARTDLTPAESEQVQDIWASWAVRRASDAMAQGHIVRGVEILQAASQDYPNNMGVRRAVAGAYARVGRYTDALALFKSLPMQDASAGDYTGAVSAAMGAGDMAQAEAWLRQALGRYPNDPEILSLAARFEQARGNNERATDFWRAALAAMPPGSTMPSLETIYSLPPGSYHAPEPGDTKRLLDPRLDPLPSASSLAPLPTYTPPAASTGGQYPYQGSSAPITGQSNPPQTRQWAEPPSNNPLPLPPSASSPQFAPQAAPNGQGTTPSVAPQNPPANNPPIYIPQGASLNKPASEEPVLVEQSATQMAQMQPAGNFPPTQSNTQAGGGGDAADRAFMGRMHLPASEQYVHSNVPAPTADQYQQQPVVAPALSQDQPLPETGPHVQTQPLDPAAAQVQAEFAEQTDAQLTGDNSAIHLVPNAPVRRLPVLAPSASGQPSDGQGEFTVAQYTPSAQEAATGAYSAPKQQAPQQSAPVEQKPSPVESEAAPAPRRHRHYRRRSTETLGNAPISGTAAPAQPLPAPEAVPQQEQAPPEELPSDTVPVQSTTGLTDQELEQRNLPPLRGPWVRIQREAPPLSPRDEAEMQLHAIESGYSGWLGGTGLLNYRSGNLGYDHLAALESPFEASIPLGYHGRLTVVAKPVFLDSGQANGTATVSVVESTTGGSASTSIPEPIGTLTDTSSNPPAQQNAVGLGGEVQLAFPHLAIAGGYTPAGFLVSTFTGRFMWRPGNGPFTFNFVRDSQTDSQLSYAGLRDPAGNSLGKEGQVWGGVVYDQGQIQFSRGDAQSGFYFAAGGQYLSGYDVEINKRIDGTGGAYWRLLTDPEYGNLSIGANFFAMHYANNQDAFTHGMGGYFSPQGYFLANVPFTWVGHYLTNWHYNIMGALGVQAFQENQTPLWPLLADKALEISQNNAMLPNLTSVGPNYDLRSQVAYQISPHWFAGGYFAANNTRNYGSASVGFFVRYMFRSQPSTATSPTGLFPADGLRPFTVP